ncbi:type II toxin-antitoxin system PemK/MazF family toxin [Adhaeribacter rhizoryzae]|uniref:mRNA interferase n=1 Tax=Adhaeribacter rhizoryzae TaxID=2607907 RepID=A0A5M6DG71_9BACT|nr:type II toxin-antitoxin system PemK/MazF family toxin [Adhaeribacter rhizoryzae]KAA5546508.1 type II toxin-antitoxin system PemK/MazF family toxin [Adhaeribacter rhizoryzae]
MEVNQYEIVLVNLDPTVGSEIQKTRPCVVVSPNEINHNLKTVVIAPMTTKSHPYPTRVKVKHNNQTGWVVIDQIRTIDKIRIVKILGQLNSSEAAACKRIIKETFVD